MEHVETKAEIGQRTARALMSGRANKGLHGRLPSKAPSSFYLKYSAMLAATPTM